MESQHEISIFYKYTRVEDPEALMRYLAEVAAILRLTGRILIAPEGINGTFEGKSAHVKRFEELLHAQDGSEGTFGDFADVWFKHSPGTGAAFPKMKIKVRDEIVTLGLGKEGDINPNEITGTHVTPQEVKKWIEDGEEFKIIDMRNDYEYQVGHFKGSINPAMENFRDLQKVAPELEALKETKVLTVCTYGVRCEKASGYLKTQGFKDVYQLEGGIGSYMKAYPGEDFLGSLFVFDNRMLERFTDSYPVVGECRVCSQKSERYANCALADCHKKIIICETCLLSLGDAWCSQKCNQESHQTAAEHSA